MLGAFMALNPFASLGLAGAATYAAISRGEHQEAGRKRAYAVAALAVVAATVAGGVAACRRGLRRMGAGWATVDGPSPRWTRRSLARSGVRFVPCLQALWVLVLKAVARHLVHTVRVVTSRDVFA